MAHKKLLLGFLMGAYGFAQLFGGPIFGRLSDKHGRKKILTISLVLSSLSSLLSGLSVHYGSIFLIYFSRILLGLSSGSIALTFAIVSDFSDISNKAKNVGYVTIGTSLGAIFGPGIGGYFSTNPTFSLFGNSTPFYLMFMLYTIATISIYFFLPFDRVTNANSKKESFVKLFKIDTIYHKKKQFLHLLLLILFFQLSCEGFYLAAPIILTIKFNLSPSAISNHFIIQGIVSILTPIIINKYISKYFTSYFITAINTIFLLICYIFLILATSSLELFIPFIGVGIFGTLIWVHTNCLLSNSVDSKNQGIIFGISQTIWGIASTLGPIFVGIFSTLNSEYANFIPIIAIIFSLFFSLLFFTGQPDRSSLAKQV